MPIDPTIPPADARSLGLAHYAARGALERVLASYALGFEHNVALRSVITTDHALSPGELAGLIQSSLKLDPAAGRAVVAELLDRELLVADGDRLAPTDRGRAVYRAAAAETAVVASRIWGDIHPDDLAAAGRVLDLVRSRADTEPARLAG